MTFLAMLKNIANRQKFELNRQRPSDILPRMGFKKCVVNQ